MRKIRVKIVGVSPLRHNRFLGGDRDASGRKKTTEKEDIQEAKDRAYFDKKEGYYLPKIAIKRCIIEGGKKIKIGRGTASNLLKAVMFIEKDINPVGDKKGKIISDVVRIPPRTGARVMKMWVINENWSCEFNIDLLDDTFPINALKEAIESAGIYYGVLDGRPEFGRFVLEKFEVIE